MVSIVASSFGAVAFAVAVITFCSTKQRRVGRRIYAAKAAEHEKVAELAEYRDKMASGRFASSSCDALRGAWWEIGAALVSRN